MNTTRTDGRVLVRPWQTDDADSLCAAVLSSHASLAHWFPWCHKSYSRDDSAAWIEFSLESWKTRQEYPMGIFCAANGEVLGSTGVHNLNHAYRYGDLGYWLRGASRGQGIAAAGARMAAQIAFEELGLTRLEVAALTHNTASLATAQRLGARREGVARNRLYFRGQPDDAVLFSLIPSDLLSTS